MTTQLDFLTPDFTDTELESHLPHVRFIPMTRTFAFTSFTCPEIPSREWPFVLCCAPARASDSLDLALPGTAGRPQLRLGQEKDSGKDDCSPLRDLLSYYGRWMTSCRHSNSLFHPCRRCGHRLISHHRNLIRRRMILIYTAVRGPRSLSIELRVDA